MKKVFSILLAGFVASAAWALGSMGSDETGVAHEEQEQGLNCLDDVNNLNDNETFTYVGDAVVIHQNGVNLFIKDECGYALVYGSPGQNYFTGDVIPAGWGGTKSTYQGFPEVIRPTGFQPAVSRVTLNPEVITPGQLDLSKWGHYLLFKNVLIDTENMLLVGEDGSACPYYPSVAADPTTRCDVYAVGTAYKGAPQVMIISTGNIVPPPPGPCCLEELYLYDKDQTVQFTCPLIAIYQNEADLYVKDTCGAYGLIYGTAVGGPYDNGDSIIGIASWTTYRMNPQLTPKGEWEVLGHGPKVEPILTTIEDLSNDMLHYYVRLNEVSLTALDDIQRQYDMADATGDMILYNRYGLELPRPKALKWPFQISGEVTIADLYFLIDHILAGHTNPTWNGSYDVEGFITIYNYQLEIYPSSITCHDGDYDYSSLDLNGDGEINIADINYFIKIILENH